MKRDTIQTALGRMPLKPVAGLLGDLAVAAPPKRGELDHLIEPRAQPPPEPVDERFTAFFIERIAIIDLFFGVQVVRGEDSQFLLVVSLVDDVEHGLFHPGRGALGSQLIQHQDPDVKDRRQDLGLAQVRFRRERALDIPDQLPEVVERAGNVLFLDQLPDDGYRQVCLSHAAGSDEEQPDLLGRIVLDELPRNLEAVLVGIVMDLEVAERAVLVPSRNPGLFPECLGLAFVETVTAPGDGLPLRGCEHPARSLALGANLFGHQLRYPLSCWTWCDRESLRIAFCSICLIRSRVKLRRSPISWSVCGRSSSSPNLNFNTVAAFSSSSPRISRICCWMEFLTIWYSTGGVPRSSTLASTSRSLSATLSLRWTSFSARISKSSTSSSLMPMLAAISSRDGSRPFSAFSWATFFFISDIWSESFWGRLQMRADWVKAWMTACRTHQTA